MIATNSILLMQLKNLGNSINAINDIQSILEKSKGMNAGNNLIQELQDVTKGYSTEVLKLATAQTKLTKEQALAIFTAKGLKGEELEQAVATATLSASETTATATTGGLSVAFKGLGASIKSTAISFKSFILANPVTAIAAIATAAIAGGVAIYTKLHPSLIQATKDLEEQKQSFDTVSKEVVDLSNELKTANERIEELQSKGSLSLVESEQLDKLKETTTELETQLAIKKEEQRLEAKKTADIADKAFHGSFRSKYDNSGELITGDAEYSNNAVKELENSIKAYRKLQEEYNKAKRNADFFAKETDKNGGRFSLTGKVDWAQYEKYAKQMSSLEKQMNSASIQAQAMYEAINGQKDAYEGLFQAGYDLNQEQLEEYQSVRQSVNAYNEFCASINDTVIAFSELDEAQKRSRIETQLVLSGLSEANAESIVDSLQAEDLDIVATLTFNNFDTIESVREAIDKANLEARGLTVETAISFNVGSYEDQINDIKSSLSTLRSALDAFNTGTMDESTVLDLMQKFPELTPYIDLAAEGFGNLSEGLSVLLAQQPASLIQSLQELKDSLNTDAEREQVDLLIDSLQSLSSYGDSGIEAYATTIGATWNDTANVIEGVTNQFENLAKVQEAVANGLTMSADAAAELAAMYPEILTNAEYAGNGQITLNEEVVKSILAGDKSIVDAQITKLEAEKAMLIAKEEAAQAELNIIQQVGNGQGHISEEVARKQISDIEQRLEAQINALNQENDAFAGTMQDMSKNAEQFDDYAGNVSNDIATNMNTASASMANGMETNSVASQYSLSGIAHKATDVAKAVAGIATGTVINNADAIYKGKGGTNSGGIKTTKSSNGYSATARDFIAGDISFDEFESQLQIDISAYQKAISNIDAQIEILKNLQDTFDKTSSSANGGIGGHDYKDKIKDLEKEKDKINGALDDAKKGSGSTKKEKDEYKELFDFFERRIKILNAALNLLKTNLDNVTGSFAKNKLIDAQIGISEEKFKNYSDALNMYTQKANEALSKLPTDIAEKIRDGAVDLTTFIGDGNKDVVEAIKDYEQWADKVADCKQELAELKTAIRQLELEKFNNIVEEFTNQFDLREDGKDLISKQIALLKEAGELIGESFFNRQIEQSKKQLELLEAEKNKLVEQMESALVSGRVDGCPLP